MALPKPPFVMPSILNGVRNGEVPQSMLEPTLFGNATAISPAARSFRAFASVMLLPRGLQLRHVGGYRSLAGQWAIFGGNQARYRPCSYKEWLDTPSSRRKTFQPGNRARVAALGFKVPDSFYWVKIQYPNGTYPATAAEPGTSNHGWGCAIDIAEERDTDPEPESLSPLMLSLLVDYGWEYGLGAEMDVEPWHWRYFAGDNIPAAVLRYEASLNPINPKPPVPPVNPTPTPVPQEEETVFKQFVTYRGHQYACYSDGTKKWYTEPMQVELLIGLRTMGGLTTETIALDYNSPQHTALMVVTGPIVGPRPADRDEWGR